MNISTPFAGLSCGNLGMNNSIIHPTIMNANVNIIFSCGFILPPWFNNSPVSVIGHYGTDVVDALQTRQLQGFHGSKPAIRYSTSPAFKLVSGSSSGSWVQMFICRQTAAHLFRDMS
jgi:hypothetical protein